MCFALAAKAGWSAEQQQRLASGLAEELAEVGRAADAASLTLEYLRNVDSAGEPRGSGAGQSMGLWQGSKQVQCAVAVPLQSVLQSLVPRVLECYSP